MPITKQQNLLELLYSIKDPRRAQGRMHSLPFILITSIMAIMNGATSINAIADFAKANNKDLFKLFKMKKKQKRVPSKETIARVFRLISFEDLSSIFYTWAKSKISIKKGDVFSLDGKSIRGTLTNPNDSFQNFTSIVSLYSQKKRQILCLEKVENKKESEIPAVRHLIKMLDLEGVTFTIDALHCQKKTISEIIENKNNYIVQVKRNQPKLYETIKKN